MPGVGGEDELRRIEAEIERCYEGVLKPLDQYGLVRRKERCRYPMVLVVGNYSSGKSTFVNHLLGINEQSVGAAPTDAGFTILLKDAHAEVDSEMNGSAVINDPELGFDELRRFGPSLEARLRLKKLRPTTQRFPDGVALVDTPGLTDLSSSNDELFTSENMHAVLLWFAVHSDLVLFLFDPHKPGGAEQQDILLALLRSGQEGKLRYVFNKTDQFATVQDFVTTFGTLCWNLSKYVQRREPPMFYTTFTPGVDQAVPAAAMDDALRECTARREELVKKISQVPFERADNLIKQAEDTVFRLDIAGKVGNELLARGGRRLRRLLCALLCLSGVMCSVLHQLYYTLEPDDPFSPAYHSTGALVGVFCLLAGYCSRLHLLGYYEDVLQYQLDDCFVTGMLGGKAAAHARPTLDDVSPEQAAVWQQLKKTLHFTVADFSRLRRFAADDWARLAESERALADLHGAAAAYRTAMGSPSRHSLRPRCDTMTSVTPSNPEL